MKQINIIFLFFLLSLSNLFAVETNEFSKWKKKFKTVALANNISEKTFNETMTNVRFLPKVIEYDRYQPEFYEDTKTYISKRSSKNKVKKGLDLYNKNKDLINTVEKEFQVERELLLSLMGIETNYGTYVGKMDILSSLATLSFDKRRSEFFTKELLILLKLVDSNKINYKTLYGSWAGAFGFFQFMPSTIKNHAIDFNNDNHIDYKTLYGSWAGAFGYFQFMPSTMKNYAIDYDKDSYIDLKNNNDAYASAANYLSQIGWNDKLPCFYKINLLNNVPKKYLNVSAKKLHNKKKLKYFRKYISDEYILDKKFDNLTTSLITPDKDIIPDAETLNPAYIVFDNYEIILKWNRSLRFSLAVCTLKDKLKNEL